MKVGGIKGIVIDRSLGEVKGLAMVNGKCLLQAEGRIILYSRGKEKGVQSNQRRRSPHFGADL